MTASNGSGLWPWKSRTDEPHHPHVEEHGGSRGRYEFRLTQRLHPVHRFGHYYWCLLDKGGNVAKAGWSCGSPPAELAQVDADRMAKDRIREHKDDLKFEEDNP